MGHENFGDSPIPAGIPSRKDIGFGLFIRDKGYMRIWASGSVPSPSSPLPALSGELPDAGMSERDGFYGWPLVPISWPQNKTFANLGAG